MAAEKNYTKAMGDLKVNVKQSINKFENSLGHQIHSNTEAKTDHVIDETRISNNTSEKQLEDSETQTTIVKYRFDTEDYTNDDSFRTEIWSHNQPKNMDRQRQSKNRCNNMIEYEKQIREYETMLRKAQMLKKKDQRKRAMARAFELKLIEIENECKIELMNIKHNLQLLEPLKATMSQWKFHQNDEYLDRPYDNSYSYDFDLPEAITSPKLANNVPSLELRSLASHSSTDLI